MPARVKRAKNRLTELSHTHVRRRDSSSEDRIAGFCKTCGKFCEGSHFQAGHYEPNSTGGALLRYHPRNMHGQGDYCCNINRHGQQRMANEYTLFMVRKYGIEYVDKLRSMKHKSIREDIMFLEKMIELYEIGDEEKIIEYLENLTG